MRVSLLIGGLAMLVVSLTYMYVGTRLARRASASDAGRAMGSFAGWWMLLGANQLVSAGLRIAAAWGIADVDAHVALAVLQRLLLALSLAGLMHYLLYLHTGRSYLAAMLLAYSGYFVLAVYSLLASAPVGVEVHTWRTEFAFSNRLPGAWQLLTLVVTLPPALGSLLLVRALPGAQGLHRLRVLMLSLGFSTWWVLAIVAGQRDYADIDWLQALARICAMLVAVGIFSLYEPSGWLRRRYTADGATSAA